MRRIVNGLLSKRDTRKKSDYSEAGFKSYENRFADVKRPCSCTSRDEHRKAAKGGSCC